MRNKDLYHYIANYGDCSAIETQYKKELDSSQEINYFKHKYTPTSPFKDGAVLNNVAKKNGKSNNNINR